VTPNIMHLCTGRETIETVCGTHSEIQVRVPLRTVIGSSIGS
jgi:hypothetical protein